MGINSVQIIIIITYFFNSLMELMKCRCHVPTVAFAIKKSDSVPIAVTSGELFIIVFIRDIGNCSVPISQLPVTFSELILTKIKYFFAINIFY